MEQYIDHLHSERSCSLNNEQKTYTLISEINLHSNYNLQHVQHLQGYNI